MRLLNRVYISKGTHRLHFPVYFSLQARPFGGPINHVAFEIVILSLYLLFVVTFKPLEVAYGRAFELLLFLFLSLLFQQKYFNERVQLSLFLAIVLLNMCFLGLLWLTTHLVHHRLHLLLLCSQWHFGRWSISWGTLCRLNLPFSNWNLSSGNSG